MTTLLIDIGNSRVKLGLWTAGALGATAAFTHEELLAAGAGRLDLLSPLSTASDALDGVWAVSVGHDTLNAALAAWCTRQDLALHWWSKDELPEGFVNAYRAPTLGADRLLAAIAAWAAQRRSDAPLVIASFGTATTVDTVLAGRYEGGMIAPGIELMLAALSAGTAHLPRVAAQTLQLDARAKTTPEAIAAGVAAAQRGLIDLALAQAEHATGTPAVLYVSGGAAAGAAGILPPHRPLPHAVL
ncbi:MAG TPA: type III pantothenate kinase, partial [Burkholderiaceae bacterium]|nr:type III pantothenate kinase [Burkholderiaceae bacterium]